MKLIKLTDIQDTPVYINAEKIVSLNAKKNIKGDVAYTVIFAGAFMHEVKEDIPTILAKLNNNH